jgi:hypothetical protein
MFCRLDQRTLYATSWGLGTPPLADAPGAPAGTRIALPATAMGELVVVGSFRW